VAPEIFKGHFFNIMKLQLYEKFLGFVKEKNLIETNCKIVVAFSGGPDSAVLLFLLNKLSESMNLKLAAAHLNHCLRADESDADEKFSAEISKEYNIPFFSEKADVKKFSMQNKLSIELGARKVRYDFLEIIRQKLDFDLIATGHNMNDQAETILMNSARGSGIRGLGGIRAKRDRIIRPLLFASRTEIEKFAEENNIKFVTDSSNLKTEYTRNRFRYSVLPAIKNAVGRDPVKNIYQSGEILQRTYDYLEHETGRLFQQCTDTGEYGEIILDILIFRTYFRIVQEQILIKIVEGFTGQNDNCLTSNLINRLLDHVLSGRNGAVTEICKTVRCYHYVSKAVFVKNMKPIGEFEVILNHINKIKETGSELKVTFISGGKTVFSDDPNLEYIDFDLIKGRLRIRSWKNGDWFYPLGMGKRKKLKDFFIDRKIPSYKKYSIPILTDRESIIWVCGLRLDHRFRITDHTKKILKLELIK